MPRTRDTVRVTGSQRRELIKNIVIYCTFKLYNCMHNLLVRRCLSIEHKHLWYGFVAETICRWVSLSVRKVLAKWLTGSGCRLRW